MTLLRSPATVPVPWRSLLMSMGLLWIAPVPVGMAVYALSSLLFHTFGDLGQGIWLAGLGLGALALIFSPLLSWVGWLIALPMVWLALARGWFGWLSAAGIGGVAGSVAGASVDTEIALPFGIAALLALRAMLGRVLPL